MTVNAAKDGFAAADEQQTQNNFAYHATLDWTPTSTSLYYVSVSQGFKSGVFPVLNASAIGQLAPISQEKLVDYEGGAKLSLLDRRLQFNTSVFYYDYTNRQVYGQIPDVVFGTLPAIVNVPKSKIYGVDGDVTFAITSSLKATVAGSELRSEIDQYTGFDPFGKSHDYSGAPLPFAPHYSLFASIAKDFQLTGALALQVAPDVTYQSDSTSYIGNDPAFRIAPYALGGASVTLRDSDHNWHVGAYVRNMFDRYYWSSTQISHDTIVRYAGMPRTFGVRATWDF
jgi:outer membrane receptor protein involved in Fe transport